MILLHIFFKGFELGVKAHDPAVRHRAEDRDAEELACFDIRGAVKSADHSRSRAPQSGRMALRAAQAKFHQRILARNGAHTARLRRDEAFMVHDHGEACLHQHRLCRGAMETEQELAGECDRAFRHGIDVSREAEIGQVVQKFRIKDSKALEVGDVIGIETEIFSKFLQVREPCDHGIAAIERILAIETVKDHAAFMHALFEERIRHGQLV